MIEAGFYYENSAIYTYNRNEVGISEQFDIVLTKYWNNKLEGFSEKEYEELHRYIILFVTC